MRSLVQVLVHGLGRQLSPFETNTVEYTVLSICFNGPLSIKVMRNLLPIDYAHLSRTISRLEDKALLRKVRSRNDRRVVTVNLTEEGASLMPELMRLVAEFYAALARDISLEEMAGCIAVMERIIAGSEGDAGGENHQPPGAESGPNLLERGEGGSGIDSPAQDQSPESLIARLQGSVTILMNVMFRGIEDGLSPFKISVLEYSVLAACSTNEPVTISGLLEYVPIDFGQMSRNVTRLSDRGLVQKERLRSNRRTVTVHMTAEGRALVSELTRLVDEHYANVVRAVSEEELTHLLDFIQRMMANADSAA